MRHAHPALCGASPRGRRPVAPCPAPSAPAHEYAYLLGQYLGDGWIGETRRDVFRLTITCAATYPSIAIECATAMSAVLPSNVVGNRARPSVIEVSCYSKHLPCLFPQHGPGYKHNRQITLKPWQESVALEQYPDRFIRGLIHSDGCRSINRVHSPAGRTYQYLRYTFSNRSEDIRRLFAAACDRLEVEWRPMNHCTISVARQASVARLDSIVGPKA